MQKRIRSVIIPVILSLFIVSVTAQNSVNSPYTRYGYGDLANRSFGAGRSMGGTGIGLRSSRQINPLNPASYSSMDSMTFLFDFGASAQMSWFSDGTNSQKDFNGNVEYIAMQFPLYKKLVMSAGLLPYSHVGYRFGEAKNAEGQYYTESFEGSGGLNQLYAGLSVELWKKRLSLGANINYLFGAITNSSAIVYTSTNSNYVQSAKRLKVKDMTLDFGLQYVHPLNKTDNLVFGLTYTPKKRLNNEAYEQVTSTETKIDTISNARYDSPTGYGFGVSYVRENKLIVAADISLQQWSNASFGGKNDLFNDRLRIAAGGEYIPNLYSRPFLNRMRYRLGLSYTNSYINVNGNGYKEYGTTLGVGIPISDNRSYINVSFEYVKVKPDYKTMIDENYFRMTLSYTFNEWWFFKMKLE